MTEKKTLSIKRTKSATKSKSGIEVKKKRVFHQKVNDGEVLVNDIPSNISKEEQERRLAEQKVKDLAGKRTESAKKEADAAKQAELSKTEKESAAKETSVEKTTKHPSESVKEPVANSRKDKKGKKAKTPHKETDRNKQTKSKGKGQSSKRGRSAYLEDIGNSRNRRVIRRPKHYKSKKVETAPAEKVFREVLIPEVITVQELSHRMSEKAADVVKKLMLMGQMVTVTQSIDSETAALIVEEFGHTYKIVADDAIEQSIIDDDTDVSHMVERAPVVTVMGHVDHGKTSLLDALRKTGVAEGEAGGITQHIGAYQVKLDSDREITFLDTPGHAAFTQMRSRGASLTDIVVLIVAADDGVMPQTIEAIKHSKAADVPIIVAINKCDKPDANPDRVKQELLSHDLIVEDFGGEITSVNISAKAGTGLKELEEMIILQSEVLELKANTQVRASGIVVESRLDKGRGSVATVIIQKGTLKIGDILVAGTAWGRVRALINDKGQKVDKVLPGCPTEVLGLQSVPDAGDIFSVVETEKKAREVASFRGQKKREKVNASRNKVSLENLFSKISEGDVQKLDIVLKADVQGSVQAITDSLNKLATEEVKVNILHSAVGLISESDVMLASASNAIIIGFNVRASVQAQALSKTEGVEIKYYNIIYNIIDEIKGAMVGLLAPKEEEKFIGYAEIREVFKISKVGTVAGCMITQGLVKRNTGTRLIRDGVVIYEGKLASLKRAKDEVKEVKEGFECGILLEDYDDIKVGDQIESFEFVSVTTSFEELTSVSKDK
ncbi:MAG: translation initiation factor IF-2 [Proteobacteria bacterium]|nr:translation initiation factor IF-2 [Pseudomonadota bacterium]